MMIENPDDLWNKTCDILKQGQWSDMFTRHVEQWRVVTCTPQQLELSVESDFHAVWFAEQYTSILLDALRSAGAQSDVTVKFSVDANASIIQKTEPKKVVSTPPPRASRRVMASTQPLNPNFTFENFVQGPSNSFAHSAAIAVAQAPGRAYNPLFIYGQTGLGKTHLMQAIGHRVLKSLGTSVCYISSETLLNEYITSLSNATLPDFRNKYRKVDVLMIDDIQFLAGKKQLQEEFFHTFNSLYDAHKQIIMTSDVAPRALPGLEDRLLSRFEWGMVNEIESPSFETRLAILRYKAKKTSNFSVPDEFMTFIAENIRSNVRALEGALTRIVSFQHLNPNLPLTMEIVAKLLRDVLDKEKILKDLSIEEIQKTVAKHYSVTIQDILSAERTQSIVTPRQVAMFISRKLTTKSLPEIAKVFSKGHPTINHGVKVIQNRLEVEPELRAAVYDIIGSLGRNPSDLNM